MSRTVVPIIKREYLTRVMTKGFWISTAIFPLMTAAFTIIPPIIASRALASPEPVRIVDTTGRFFPILQDLAEKSEGSAKAPPFEEEPLRNRTLDQLSRDLNRVADSGAIQGYMIIDQKALDAGEIVLHAKNPSSAVSAEWLRTLVRPAVMKYRLLQQNVPRPAIDEAIEQIDFNVVKATNDPKKRESGIAALFMSFGLVMFIYLALIFYGIYVLRGVLEEKSSRIVEIIVSSVKPFDLMMGKILGIGAVGLTQITIWVLFAVVFSAPQVASLLAISEDYKPAVNTASLVFFPVFFVLGYFLYATIYAGIGAMFNSDEDAQQLATIAQLFLAVPVMVLTLVLKNPNGGVAIGLSLFPFFAPILMYLRIAIETPPAWQIALSIGIMIATIVLMIWIVSKIYRVGILMYGKKPTIPELVRWLRYS